MGWNILPWKIYLSPCISKYNGNIVKVLFPQNDILLPNHEISASQEWVLQNSTTFSEVIVNGSRSGLGETFQHGELVSKTITDSNSFLQCLNGLLYILLKSEITDNDVFHSVYQYILYMVVLYYILNKYHFKYSRWNYMHNWKYAYLLYVYRK